MIRPFLFLVALAALLAAGCGGTSEQPVTKAQYEQHLDRIGKNLYTAANNLGQSTNTQIFIDGVDELKKTLNDAADDLDGVTPPGAKAQAANGRLVGAYRDLADEFDQVKDARRESFPRAVAELQKVQTSTPAKETIQAARELRALGFNVPVFATLGSA